MRLNPSDIKARADEKIYNAKQGFKSWQGFLNWVRVKDTALDQHGSAHTGGPQWSNEDLDPTPPEKRELV